MCDFFLPHTSQSRLKLTSPYHSLPVLLIMPLFALTEYLLAYLLLITDSRLSVSSYSTTLSHTHTHSWTPFPCCPWQSLIGLVSKLVGASHSVNGWLSHWSAIQSVCLTDQLADLLANYYTDSHYTHLSACHWFHLSSVSHAVVQLKLLIHALTWRCG